MAEPEWGGEGGAKIPAPPLDPGAKLLRGGEGGLEYWVCIYQSRWK